jgi:hypothetical protein
MNVMKLKIFKCHAVMPLSRDDAAHAIRTYFVAAASAETARMRVLEEAGTAEFVTAPLAMTDASSELQPAILLTETATISPRELVDLRSAHQWRSGAQPHTTAWAPEGLPDT